MRKQPVFAVLAGGLTAGTLDILYAIISLALRDRSPLFTLQSVATGWLGKDAFAGGVATGLLGLASHFAIALVIALVFYLASRRLPVLRQHWAIGGVLYGIGVYLVMSHVVVPLSAAPFRFPVDPVTLLKGFLSHGLLVGLPIAWFAKIGTDPISSPAK